MCLTTVFKEVKHPSGIGWKAFRVDEQRHLHNRVMGDTGRLPVGVWIRDKYNGSIRVVFSNTYYKAGFHVYIENPWKEGFSEVRLVEFRDVVAEGLQSGTPIVVARQMRIIPRKEEKECLNQLRSTK